jgi:hypothetical protein
MDYRIQANHQFVVALARFAESLGLRSKYARDGLWTVAVVELLGEWVGA